MIAELEFVPNALQFSTAFHSTPADGFALFPGDTKLPHHVRSDPFFIASLAMA
jgi:hypothetical protein